MIQLIIGKFQCLWPSVESLLTYIFRAHPSHDRRAIINVTLDVPPPKPSHDVPRQSTHHTETNLYMVPTSL
jgi:hypothetical protein